MALEMTLKRSKKPVYPTKTTINLAVDDKGENKMARNLVLFAVALVLIALFAKFAVVDVMAAASAASGQTLVVAALSRYISIIKAPLLCHAGTKGRRHP